MSTTDPALCPHCGVQLYPRCLCWQSGDDEWDDREEEIESGIPADDYRDEEW